MFSRKAIKPLEKKVWLSSPTMHGEELAYMTEAYELNWMSTVGENITEVERIAAKKLGCRAAVSVSPAARRSPRARRPSIYV